jgi:hypothetical protein
MALNKLYIGYNNKPFNFAFLSGNQNMPNNTTNNITNNNITNNTTTNNNSNIPYIHITSTPTYYVLLDSPNIIIDVNTIIYLPELISDGITINIVNNSGTSLSINSQISQLIYSSMYIKKGGSTNFYLDSFKFARLINVHKNNVFAWILLMS